MGGHLTCERCGEGEFYPDSLHEHEKTCTADPEARRKMKTLEAQVGELEEKVEELEGVVVKLQEDLAAVWASVRSLRTGF